MSPDELKPFALLAELSDEDREALVELLEERELPFGQERLSRGIGGRGARPAGLGLPQPEEQALRWQ